MEDRRSKEEGLLEKERNPQSPEANPGKKHSSQNHEGTRTVRRAPKTPPAGRSPTRKKTKNLGHPVRCHA